MLSLILMYFVGISILDLSIWIVGGITKNEQLGFFSGVFIGGILSTMPIHILNFSLVKKIDKPKILLFLSFIEMILLLGIFYIFSVVFSITL